MAKLSESIIDKKPDAFKKVFFENIISKIEEKIEILKKELSNNLFNKINESSDEYVYHVVNRHTKEVKGKYTNKNRARNKMDKLDNEYGGYAHSIHAVKKDGSINKSLSE